MPVYTYKQQFEVKHIKKPPFFGQLHRLQFQNIEEKRKNTHTHTFTHTKKGFLSNKTIWSSSTDKLYKKEHKHTEKKNPVVYSEPFPRPLPSAPLPALSPY